MEFSLRYTPVTGRLHTRYAPVRRSSAAYCYAPLPLDLHVLSLPLAFILSQDQTLHCKNCSLRFYVSRLMFYVLRSPLTSLTRLRVLIISYIMIDTRYLFLLIISNLSRFPTPFFRSKTAAKIQPFFIPTKYFFQKHEKNKKHYCLSAAYIKKKIIDRVLKPRKSRCRRPPIGPKLAPPMTKNAKTAK